MLFPFLLQPVEHLGSVPFHLIKVRSALKRMHIFIGIIVLLEICSGVCDDLTIFEIKNRAKKSLWHDFNENDDK